MTGLWIGIDLGTSTTTAAVWDISRQRSKVLRFPSSLSQILPNGKRGRCIPSAALCLHDDILLGYESIQAYNNLADTEDRPILITSAKRIWGMTYLQIKDELQRDENFLKSLPFETKLIDAGDSSEGLKIRVKKSCRGDSSSDEKYSADDDTEWIEPLVIAKTLLSSIRLAAQDYIYRQRRKLHVAGAPESNDKELFLIRNCVLTIPAQYSRNQRRLLIEAAKSAGFHRVETIIESTAASLSYGLFVSPKVRDTSKDIHSTPAQDDLRGTRTCKIILVFDMGAGTTDVTISEMNIDPHDNDPKFQIVATAGDRHLGGDDMDDALAQYFVQKSMVEVDTSEYASLRLVCRKAKEELCGNDCWKIARQPQPSVMISWMGLTVTITQEDFSALIEPLVDRARKVIDEALISWNADQSFMIDEVVVIGGASRTPSIHNMLATRFPPPHPIELCYSIQGEAAVAQGAAIQAAILSKLVPIYELRNAMMLDALPHTIGVLTQLSPESRNEGFDEEYVTILSKNSPLPAKGTASFYLENTRQKGINITVIEDVGDEYPLQKVCECQFLLHRLTENEIKLKCPNGTREVLVELTAKEDGTLIVSYFDENDPEHIRRRNGVVTNDNVTRSKDEIILISACVFFFILYVCMKLSFKQSQQYSSYFNI